MMKSVYSFGEDSPVKFEISSKTANLYNQAVKEFIRAHTRFSNKYGRHWDPTKEPIKIKWSRAQQKAWNAVADMVNQRIAETGPIPVGDFADDFLVRNAAIVALARTFGKGLDMVVAAVVIHVLIKETAKSLRGA